MRKKSSPGGYPGAISDNGNDPAYMSLALREAGYAADKDEVPVGAVIAYRGRVIARAHNQVEMLKDPTAHAEMIAITQAAAALGNKWLSECVMYVTIEPCSMCAGALVLARVARVVYGAADPKTGACGSVLDIVNHGTLNHRIAVTAGILADECAMLLSDFFQNKRRAGKK
ncbi:MAG: tRNA adenosine(34) deaminase TadA [Candidatus Omnitrophica bacterium]|nr:tRNA adenosine(34) deaminase TadA [Candidatus Omnitrophota bacterium]